MLRNYTARYVKTRSGYMGQLVEWPEVLTEGRNLDECREMLQDALSEMVVAYRGLRKPLPAAAYLLEPLSVEVDDARPKA